MAEVIRIRKEGARRRAVLELLASRFQIASALKMRYILEASAHSYIREGYILRATPVALRSSNFDQTLENLGHELEFCNRKLDQQHGHVMRVVANLHRRVIQIDALHPDNKDVQLLCENLLRSPLPTSPAPGKDVDTLEKIDAWLEATTKQAEEDIAVRFLGQIDTLFDLV